MICLIMQMDRLHVPKIYDKDIHMVIFASRDRLNLINQSILSLPEEDLSKIKVEKFNNLLVHYVKSKNASLIIRGLRAVSDFEYEFQLAGMNKKLNSKISKQT